jgi:aminoglycoside 3-N-acetyltransferase I
MELDWRIMIERVGKTDSETFEQIRGDLEETDWDCGNALEFLADPNNFLIVAKTAERVVGALIAHRLARLDSQRAQILLYEIGVHPDFQRRGVASAMIQEIKDLARRAGACEIWVVTNKSNQAAMQLYRSTGGTAEQDDDVVFEFRL